MEKVLDQKLEQMNQATAQEKINDMAAVINELVNQRTELLNSLQTIR